jgi:hypothetical protein
VNKKAASACGRIQKLDPLSPSRKFCRAASLSLCLFQKAVALESRGSPPPRQGRGTGLGTLRTGVPEEFRSLENSRAGHNWRSITR